MDEGGDQGVRLGVAGIYVGEMESGIGQQWRREGDGQAE